MDHQQKNSQQLNDFVSVHHLRNRNSITHFYALVSITTAQNKVVNQREEIMISFDNYDSYGQVQFQTGDFDPLLYPTVFDGKWQDTTIEHVDGEFLRITGNHKRNPAIGQYSVRISPLQRVRD